MCAAQTNPQQVRKYRQVAQKLAALLQRSLASCFRSWREATDGARVSLLRADRHHATSTLHKLLPAWQEAAADAKECREAAEAAADKLARRQLLSKACCGWMEEMQVVQAQRQGLWQVMLVLLGQERKQLLGGAALAWRSWVQHRVSLRSCVAAFVNKRRLACLSEFLTLWQQYAAAMKCGQGDEAAAAAGLLQQALTPPARPRSPSAPSPTAAGHCTWPAGARASSPPAFALAAASRCGSPAGGYVPRSTSPPGVLPVTGGPESPLLGPRSAQQDRRMARRLAVMAGAGPEVGARSALFQPCFNCTTAELPQNRTHLPGERCCLGCLFFRV